MDEVSRRKWWRVAEPAAYAVVAVGLLSLGLRLYGDWPAVATWLAVVVGIGVCCWLARRNRREAEASLRDSEEKYRLMVESSLQGVIIFQDERFRFANRAVAEFLGYTVEELTSLSMEGIRGLLHREDEPAVWRNIADRLAGKDVPPRYELRVVRRDGAVRWLDISSGIIAHEGRPALHTVCVDVTERKGAEEALRHSARRFRELFEHMSSGVAVYEALDNGNDFIIKDFNQAAQRIENVRREDVLNRSVLEAFPGVRHLGLFEIFQRVWRTGQPERQPVSLYKDERIAGWRENYVYRLPSGEVVAVCDDVTERKQAEEALRRSETLLRDVFEAIPDLMTVQDRELRIVLSNWHQHDFVTTQEREGNTHCYACYMHRDEPCEACPILEAFATGRPTRIERANLVDGRIREVNAFPVFDEAGNVTLVAEHVRDITERKEAENALRASEERFRAIADYTYAWENWISPQGRPLWINPSVEKVTGYTAAECMAMPDYPLSMVHEEDRAMLAAAYEGATKETSGSDLRFRIRRKDGVVRLVAVCWQPIFNDQGLRLGHRSSIRDITDRVRAEDEAQRRQAELAHVWRLNTTGELASVLAHELNQPLCAISSCAQACARMLRSGLDKEELVAATMEEVVAQAERAGEITRRLRSFVRKQDPQRATVDVAKLIKEAVGFAEAEARRRQVRLRLELGESLPPVWADGIQIQQVILNLVRNGIEAMEGTKDRDRQVTIRASTTDGPAVTVAVEDAGSGLAPGGEEQVFESFFTTKPQGLGLGLSISRSIIETHGGRLWATANAERGATFSFTLPIAEGVSNNGN